MPSGEATSSSIGGAGGRDVELHPPSGEPGERHVAEHRVRIGDRRPLSAPPVARRTGVRSGALRTHQQGALTHPGDGAAAGADALHVDHGQTDVVPVPPVPVDRDGGLTVAHDAEVEAGAAHVDGHEVALARRLGGDGGSHHPAGGARAEQGHRMAGHRLGGHDAAGGVHEQELPGVASRSQPVGEVRHVPLDARGDVGVDQRGRRALELGPARQHLVGQRHVGHVGVLVGDDLRRPPLVVGVHEAEQEHHGDRLHAERLEAADPVADGVLVEGQHDVALEVAPLGDRDAGPPPGDGSGSGVGRVPDLLLVDPPHLDLVAVAFGDEQPGGRAVHLDHRVVGSGGAVDHDVEPLAQLTDVEPEAFGQLGKAVHHADRLVVERRRHLVEHDVAGGGDADDVGEGATDVDADAVAAGPVRGQRAAARCSTRRVAVASSSMARVRSSSEPVRTTP